MNDSLLYKFLRPIVTFLVKVFLKPKYVNLNFVPKDGKIILAGNHTHILDAPLLISTTKRSIHFLAKDELWKGPKRIIFANLGLIPVNRREKDNNALILAKKYLKGDRVVAIFPEGTIEKEKGKTLPFKMGAIKMAYDSNSMIVPFAITGSYKLFSKDLKIKFGKPMKISNDFEKERDKLKETIEKMMKGK